MLDKLKREPNFIEKRRQWKGDLDKPLGRRTLIMALPALIMCVFVVMAAPYLKIIAEKVLGLEATIDLKSMNLADQPEAVEPEGPPPDPEEVLAQRYRDALAAQGIDWRNPPVLPRMEARLVQATEVPITKFETPMPSTVAELEAIRRTGD